MPKGIGLSGLFQGRLLRAVLISGIILSALISIPLGILSVVSFIRSGVYREEDSAPDQGESPDPAGSWTRSLGEFDALLAAGTDPDQLNRILNRLEKRTIGVESRLSVLKRRRELSGRTPRFLDAYRNAAQKAADAFPYSRPLAALAAAALIQDSPMTEALAGELEKFTPLLDDGA
ncbi:MAG: hypothetical protein LBG42_05815, partial [Treponema sp.]|nr:hypothetical protein [Treponema sp.]